MITNYISQFDGKLGKDSYYIYYSNTAISWRYSYADNINLGLQLMSKECAVELSEDLNSEKIKL